MNKPNFEGRPLIETPEVPMIGYLTGELKDEFEKRYKSILHEKYHDNKNLNVLDFSGDTVKGSNTYSSVLAAEILKDIGFRTARPIDLEKARNLYKSNELTGLDTSGHYVDLGVVYRSTDNPNKYLAKKLAPQIKKAVGKIDDPIVILSEGLDIVNDDEAPEGLSFKLNGSGLIKAPTLKETIRFSKINRDGMPIKNKNGSRASYTINSGLSGLGLDRFLDLDSGWHGLADSGSGGRVVAVSEP